MLENITNVIGSTPAVGKSPAGMRVLLPNQNP